jgi:hypothetical protein
MYSSTLALVTLVTLVTLAAQRALAYPQLARALPQPIKGNPLMSIIDGLVINVAGPDPNDPRFTNWTAPGPNDLRGPCPCMNTMANHGFINHSGRDLYVPDIMKGLAEGMNIGFDFSSSVCGLYSSSNITIDKRRRLQPPICSSHLTLTT